MIGSRVRLKFTTKDLARAFRKTEQSVRQDLYSGKLSLGRFDVWEDFWYLVKELERRGLRPNP